WLCLRPGVPRRCRTLSVVQRGTGTARYDLERTVTARHRGECAACAVLGESRTKEVHMQRRWLVLLSLLVALVCWSTPGWGQHPKPGGTLRIALPGDPAF